jgi:phage/plasmid-like protein (TIGR03299 family)
MAHEISHVSGRAEMFYAGEVPWHRLGTKVDHLLTGAEALTAAGLDWTVEQRPMFFRPRSGDSVVEVPDRVANVRSDFGTYLGTVGKTFTPIQNDTLFEFADALLAEGAKFETAGALRDGRRIWALARIGADVAIGDGDQVQRYMCLCNGHDGSLAFRAFLTPIRVVCANTLSASMPSRFGQGHEAVSIRHTSNAMNAVKEAQKVLGLVTASYDKLADCYRRLRAFDCTAREATDYFAALFPIDETTPQRKKRTAERQSDLLTYMNRGRGADLGRGTWWAAYNAVTEQLSHQKRFTGKNDAARLENRMQQLVLGGPAKQIGARALALALDGTGN